MNYVASLITGVVFGFFFFFRPIVAEVYHDGDRVTLWMSKIGPYNNPQETYDYYKLPFCHPSVNATQIKKNLGDILGGNKLVDSQIDIRFKRKVEKIAICEFQLEAAMIKQFNDAIHKNYWFEFFMDDLPLWGFLGEEWPEWYGYQRRSKNIKYVLYTHKKFDIHYNGNQIIFVNLTQCIPEPIAEGTSLNMTYSVNWIPTAITYSHRFDVYLDYYFFEHQIHWFSVLNSLVMVIFLAGLVAKILKRTLSNVDTKFALVENKLDALEKDVNEETGWKVVHGDVFRPPKNLALLSAFVGAGAQLAMLVFLVIVFTISGKLYIRRGAIFTTFAFGYAVTSFISGYVSGQTYSRWGGEKWIKAMVMTTLLLPFMCIAIGFIPNTTAILYGSSAAMTSDSMLLIVSIWVFVSLPLTVAGTVIGRNWSSAPNDPCPTKTIPRPIPDQKYFTPSIISLVGGLLPFGSILIEVYFIFTSIWNYKVYYLYGVLFLVFVLLLIITTCVTIAGTYFLLSAENYHWQWTSFFCAASTALYAFLYAVYYYHVKVRMSGFLQTSIYFGYSLMLCLGLGFVCGAVGYLGANFFVRWIYRNIKCE